jgi:hypothetical protein
MKQIPGFKGGSCESQKQQGRQTDIDSYLLQILNSALLDKTGPIQEIS